VAEKHVDVRGTAVESARVRYEEGRQSLEDVAQSVEDVAVPLVDLVIDGIKPLQGDLTHRHHLLLLLLSLTTQRDQRLVDKHVSEIVGLLRNAAFNSCHARIERVPLGID